MRNLVNTFRTSLLRYYSPNCLDNKTLHNPKSFAIINCHPNRKYSFNNSKLFNDRLLQSVLNYQYRSKSTMQSKDVEIPMPWGCVKAQIFGNPLNKHLTPILAIHGYLDNSNSFKPLAPYLCRDEYYIISIDLPGHGLSSKLPAGIPYTPKLFLSSIRRVVNYFDLKHFILLCHSYGVITSLLYDTVFQGEVKAILAIDWVFGMSSRKWLDLSTYWKEGIDTYIEYEQSEKKQNNQSETKTELSPELAIKILLKANKHLDEASAKLLLERALIKNEKGNLIFSRDIYVKLTMSLRDHYIELVQLQPDIAKYLTAPTICIHAIPPSYGEVTMNDTMKTINAINKGSRTKIELAQFEGTHHFHMIKPKETAVILLKFLDKIKVNPSTKL